MSRFFNRLSADDRMKSAGQQFEILVQRQFDHELTPEEFDQLQQLLLESEANRQFYLNYASVHALLSETVPASIPMSLSEPTPRGDSGRPKVRHRGVRVVLAVVMLASVFGGISYLGLRLVQGPGHGVASDLENSNGSNTGVLAWVIDGNRPDESRQFKSGDHVHQSGGCTALRFANGVEVQLFGLGDLEVISPMVVRLHSGQVQVDVGEEGRGFSVLTDSANVVDLGTVFGVGVNSNNETDIIVFSGEVDVAQGGGNPSAKRSETNLFTGEAVRVKENGQRARIPMIWQNTVDAEWSTEANLQKSSLISSVRDNLSTASRPKFYAIVPGGFREHAQAFVDRTYEWVGIDEAGLPADLVGSDYIRTFNEDKFEPDVEIVLKLTGPADIHILIDKRHPVPKWLGSNFVDSGRTVHLYRKKYGPTVCSVWKREVRTDREVRLGPVRKSPQTHGGAMYGIVVSRAAVDH